MNPLHRTKIVATLGPATSSDQVIKRLILTGMDVARLNFSHGSAADHRERARKVRALAARHGRFVALRGDLQDLKIRIARFETKRVSLTVGQSFTLSNTDPKDARTASIVGID